MAELCGNGWSVLLGRGLAIERTCLLAIVLGSSLASLSGCTTRLVFYNHHHGAGAAGVCDGGAAGAIDVATGGRSNSTQAGGMSGDVDKVPTSEGDDGGRADSGGASPDASGGKGLDGAGGSGANSDGVGASSGQEAGGSGDLGERCAVLDAPSHGKVTVASRSPGGVATYSCDEGYEINGSPMRTCRSTGTWSDTEPACVANCVYFGGCAEIAAHAYFTCTTHGGGPYCWGSNGSSFGSSSSLGVGQTYDQLPQSEVPLPLLSLGQVDVLSTGADSHHACAIAKGSVRCWGDNGAGQLGDGTSASRNAPVQVVGLNAGVVDIVTGALHSCALVNQQVTCWGDNTNGQLGVASTQLRPIALTLVGAQAIAAGARHSCALVEGDVWCWGANNAGQLGNDSTEDSSSPVKVSDIGVRVEGITAGGDHTCALAVGQVWCWGANDTGQVGDGTTHERHTPAVVLGLVGDVKSVKAGAAHTCAVAGNSAWCWGSNYYGQLGDNSTTDSWSPVKVELGATPRAIAAGGKFSCARTEIGDQCWGDNGDGQLGDNSIDPSSVPVLVSYP